MKRLALCSEEVPSLPASYTSTLAGFTPVWAFKAALTRAATASKGSSDPWARSTDTS